MPCDCSPQRLGAYLDGELSDAERADVARHLGVCPDCAALAAALRETSGAIKGLGREPLPAGLSERLRQNLAAADAGLGVIARAAPQPAETPPSRLRPALRPHLRPLLRPLLRQAAVLAAACLLSVLATWWVVSGATRDALLTQDLLSAHLRALLQDSPIQVASADTHTVKPWFAGKLDVSPEVRDLGPQGFPLLGARLDSIGGRRVGVLVYKRRLHLIDVFVWQAAGAPEAAPALSARNGYNLLLWTRAGVSYAAVSDLDPVELGRLPDLR